MRKLLALIIFTVACVTSPVDAVDTSSVTEDLCNGSCQCVPIDSCTTDDVENEVCCPAYHRAPLSETTTEASHCTDVWYSSLNSYIPTCWFTVVLEFSTFNIQCSRVTTWTHDSSGGLVENNTYECLVY